MELDIIQKYLDIDFTLFAVNQRYGSTYLVFLMYETEVGQNIVDCLGGGDHEALAVQAYMRLEIASAGEGRTLMAAMSHLISKMNRVAECAPKKRAEYEKLYDQFLWEIRDVTSEQKYVHPSAAFRQAIANWLTLPE